MQGYVKSDQGELLESVAILQDGRVIALSDSRGYFRLPKDRLSGFFTLQLLGFESKEVFLECNSPANVEIRTESRILDDVEVAGRRVSDSQWQAGMQEISPKVARENPLPFGDFTQVLASLPGVIAPSEFSSAYAVRGGNYDENLVYVNDMMVYRPQLFSNGQQEGLSFINPDLVQRVQFSSGGWSAMYGDRLSSNMLVEYKQPKKFAGSFMIGLLGGRAHIEDASKSGRVRYLLGVRHKRAGYLFQTLELDGEYFPRFTDIQGLTELDLHKDGQKENKLTFLLSYARNRYEVIPRTRLSEFGNFFQSFRFVVGFDGSEEMRFDTYMGGAKWEKTWTGKLRSQLISSVTRSSELENYDIDGSYRLCDVDNDPSSATFNQCIVVRGIGRNYLSARNRLEMLMWQNEMRWIYEHSKTQVIRLGISHLQFNFADRFQEYVLNDSADFVTVQRNVNTANNLQHFQSAAFVEYDFRPDSSHYLNAGVRLIFQSLNGQWLLSPRLRYAYTSKSNRSMVYRAAWGIYHQPPMFRELRNFDGIINPELRAQSSMHFIAGFDRAFYRFGREFRLMTEAYYKHLYQIVPYDFDNIRIRYYGENAGIGYAAGVDFRVSGEFIPGDESWFSIGILQTQENVSIDNRGYIPRPTNQWLNFGVLFQDHLPNNPNFRVMVNAQIVSGFPFGPPNVPEFRATSTSRTYRRVDLGFSKLFPATSVKHVQHWSVGIDILNLVGANNVISYSWIQDVNGNGIAIPNTLSARFFHLKMAMLLE